ncbi:MAG: bifunctional phosphoribosylaminoimidazolecarboxamide formyltransferase/IMP cyclohydrolase [Phycisphaerae bacterium]|nr:bifunctional phosphoribosylaminoimidazolecarboxamide formyltransferase/IMP cyclohydrolase [Phycisphaerae bacterium]
MGQIRVRRALISVYDKTGIVEFARSLHADFGIEIISTGGTAKTLRDAGIPVTLIEDITGFPEMLDGRVKTLHPNIHAAILADRDNPEHMRQLEAAGIKPIDMVVVNLYPFEKTVADPNCTLDQAIEMIDIGGVALLRAAAKNHKHVSVWTSVFSERDLIERMLRNCEQSIETRRSIAMNTLSITASYDWAISRYLAGGDFARGVQIPVVFSHYWPLRYGENSHQTGGVYSTTNYRLATATGTPNLVQGPRRREGHWWAEQDMTFSSRRDSWSYNNYLDADAALALCADIARSFSNEEPRAEARGSFPTQNAVCVFVKHNNACGVGVVTPSSSAPEDVLAAQIEAYSRAYLGDPNAAMGGVLACNFDVDAEFAQAVMSTFDRLGKPLRDSGAAHAPGGFFVEAWAACGFSEDSHAVIRGELGWLDSARDREGVDLSPSRIAQVRALVGDAAPKAWGKNLRLVPVGPIADSVPESAYQFRSIAGGVLIQTPDTLALNESDWKIATNRAPTAAEMRDLRLAWLICKHTKSNAITICKDGRLIGNGAGQMSRVMSCRIATWLAKENGHADALAGSVAASDAFFPFKDGPQILIDAGVTALIQPGGSKRDDETIALCNERGIAMILTGARHFRH